MTLFKSANLNFRALTRGLIYAAPFALVAACSGSDAEVPAEGAESGALELVASDVAVAEIGDVSVGVLLTGMLEPAQRVTVTAQVPGIVGSLSADRGTRVSAGQRLAFITADGVRSQAAGARAAVAAAEAGLAAARTRRDGADKLFRAGATSRADFENAEASFKAAEAQLAAATAQQAAAEEMAGYTAVVAPFVGVVSDRMIETGQIAAMGDPLFTVVNTSTLELAGRAPVDEAAAISVGQEVRFVIDAFPGREFTGRVTRKDPVAESTSRQVGVYVLLTNPGGEITAGQYARGTVTGRTVRDVVRIPDTAVLGSGAEAHVFVISGNRVQRRPVVVGAVDSQFGLASINSGLAEGEMVLQRPAPNTADGQSVVIIDMERQS